MGRCIILCMYVICFQENRPPYISMPNRYYAFENSEFQLVFNATDPEGYVMHYSYDPNTDLESASVDQNRKVVTFSVKRSTRVSLNVMDYGGLKDNHSVEIISLPCSCRNAGNKHVR